MPLPTFSRQTFIGADGLKLAADVGGSPDHPVVILLHGGGQTRHSWGRAMHELVRRGYRVINLDARGHGDSEWAADVEGYALARYAADLRCVIATVAHPPAVIGASMGGLTAMLALGHASPAIAAVLVLVDVVPRVEPDGASRILSFMGANLDGFTDIEAAADAVAAYNPNRPRPRDIKGLAKNLRLHDDGRWRWHWDPKFVRQTPRSHGYSVDSILDHCRHIEVPALLIRGMHSDIVSERGIDELRGCMPQLETFDVAAAGHMIAGDKNDAFNRAMLDFLARHMPGEMMPPAAAADPR